MQPGTTESKKATKSIGGPIPEDLYWLFKKAQAERQESVGKALEIAIRLYVDAIPDANGKETLNDNT